MEIYAASDGYVLQLTRSLADYSTVDDVTKDIAPHLGIDNENILLFLEDGRELKDRVLVEALERGGYGQGSETKSEVLFLFNRETFWTEPEIWAEKCQEELFLPPLIDPDSIQEVSEAHQPFFMAQDHIHHILSLFAAQYKALSLAYQNLEHHLAPLREEWNTLSKTADERLKEQLELLESAPNDLAILPKVPIHQAFWSKRDTAGNVVSRGKDESKDKTLADYIHARKMEEVIDTCRASYEDISERFRALAEQMDDLLQMAAVEKDRAEENANVIRMEFDQALNRTEQAIGAITDASQNDEFLDVALELEEIMRHDLDHLTALKNDYTLELHIHLRQVAHMESRIAEVIKPLTTLETDFKSKGAFPHLTRLHNLPFAYISLVLEYRWRRQFGGQFALWCKQLNEAIGLMLLPERERRAEMNKDISGLNFITLWGIKESSFIYCDFTIMSGGEVLEKLVVDDTMIDELDQWINGLVGDVESSFPTGPKRDALTETVRQLLEKYNALQDAFRNREVVANDRSWDKKMLSIMRTARDDEGLLEESAPRLDIDQDLRDEMELRHREEVEGMLQRQVELQDEVHQLRTDLGEEVLARQTLTAEIDERNRLSEDRGRDQEEQSEFITALQADMVQEKDRATDLGVRLQEALLDVDGLRNTEQSLLAQLSDMRDERTKHFQSTSEAQATADELRSHVAGLQAELEASAKQLASAQQERDVALRSQSAEAERLMRDRIAEADGDRAVLEHQNLNLSKEVEDLKIELAEKLSAVRNNATRQADGFKAELAMSKAQLREAQRKEAVLSDELATTKDTATAVAGEKAHQAEVARDAVALATKYYDTCRPLLRILNAAASSKRNGSDEAEKEKEDPGKDKPRPKSPVSAAHSTISIRDSVLIRSLASAQQFDLDAFTEVVNKVVIRTKRYQKAYKHSQSVCKNRITFTDFQKGDLALFLPTRDPSRRHWAAFNVNAPHHFLKADERMQEEAKSRDWIMARITSSEEAVAGETPETNPIGLASGLRYQIHGTEPFDPLAMPRNPRRSTSMGMNSLLLQDTSPTSVMGSSVRPVLPPFSTRTSGMISGLPTSLRETVPLTMSPGLAQRNEGYFPPIMPAVMEQVIDEPAQMDQVNAEPVLEPTSLGVNPKNPFISPEEVTVPPPSVGQLEITSVNQSTASSAVESSVTSVPMAPPISTSHYRRSSRSTLSPTTRETPLFAPSSLGRPASVASSHSTHSRGLPIGTPGGKAAPAMAITSSTGSGNFSPGSHGWAAARPPSGSSFSSQRDSGSGTGTGTGTGGKGSPLGIGTASTSAASTSTGGLSSMARTISRGFSIKPQKSSGGTSSAGSMGGSTGKPQSAADILKQYGESK